MMKNIMGALTIASAGLLSSCDGTTDAYNRAEKYMQNKTQSELNEVREHKDSYLGDYSSNIKTQSKLDSVAYRDVFMTTQAAKDSSKVAEFNKIAQQNRARDVHTLDDVLANKVTVKEYNQIMKKAMNGAKPSCFTYEYPQYKTDSVAYRQFFEKHNLLDVKTLKMFNKVSKQIKP